MKNFIPLLSCPHKSTAKVVDGKLILSFPGALKPVLWQMDMSSAKASALEIEERDSAFGLVLKTPRGDAHDIAAFGSKDQAVRALVIIGGALERAHGHMRSGSEIRRSQALVPVPENDNGGGNAPGVFKWLAGLTGIVILVLMVNTLWAMGPRLPVSVPSAAGGAIESLAPGEAAKATGVPVSADDYLLGQ